MPPAPSWPRISYAPKRTPGDNADGTEPGVSGELNEPHWRSGWTARPDCSTLRDHLESDIGIYAGTRCGITPRCAYNTQNPRGIHGYSNPATPTEGAVSPKPVEFADHPAGARQPDGCSHYMLCGPRPGDLQGTSPPGRRRIGYRCLLRRFTPGCNRCVRTDHLPNGRRCDGHTNGGHRCYRRGRLGSAGNAGN